MKAHLVEEKKFTPIVLTLESQEEVDQLCGIFQESCMDSNFPATIPLFDLLYDYAKDSTTHYRKFKNLLK